MDSKACIYKITSPSGKVYIGQTLDYTKRFKVYKRLACKSQKMLYCSFVKYSVEAHLFEILIELPSNIKRKELDELEIKYIEFYRSANVKMLNLTIGGRGTKGYVYTDEVKERIRKSKIGIKLSEETKAKQSGYSKNRTLAHKENLGKSISKEVLQFDLDGNFIKEWHSLLSTKGLGFGDVRSSINKRQLHAGGYIWYYRNNLPLSIIYDILSRKEKAAINEKERRNKISATFKHKR